MYIVKITDGLGNQMFQYAFAKCLERKTTAKVYLDTRFINNEDYNDGTTNAYMKNKNDIRRYGLNCFRITLKQGHSGWLKLARQIFHYVDEDVDGISGKYILPTYFKGYFFDLKYLESNKNILQREFTLKEKVRLPQEIQRALKQSNTVSIHIRRGDFIKLNRDISQKDYYAKAIEFVKEHIENPFFLIFSDDIEWVQRNMNFPTSSIYISAMGFKDYEELIIMKHCKNNIIANSTFSYWGAFLNSNPNKIVVCPKGWKTDIIPDGWINI